MIDDLWKHFALLLPELNAIGERPILVAGGFGLIMKQQWLLSEEGRSEKIIVPLERWKDPQLRSTKDVDIAIGLDLLCNPENQKSVAKLLNRNGFTEDVKYWKWTKQLPPDNEVVIELHAPTSGIENTIPELKKEGNRIKGPGKNSIHGYANAELVGHDVFPFSFTWKNVEVSLPNPATYLLMKLTAAEERWAEAQNPEDSRSAPAESRDQAFKHARDAYRVLAMVTSGEYETSSDVVKRITSEKAYQRAQDIVHSSFVSKESWNVEEIKKDWEEDDIQTLQGVLVQLFPGS
tara:strand:- start:1440 stop:2315 length:876 start_codon:yes stop_codon:yes gene_type:complete